MAPKTDKAANDCVECGSALPQRCTACGTPFNSGRFCAECGEALRGAPAAVPRRPEYLPAPEAERWLVWVLFADLLGFTWAASAFREAGTRFWLAVSLLEHGEWLVGRNRVDEARAPARRGPGDRRAAQGTTLAHRLEPAGGREAVGV